MLLSDVPVSSKKIIRHQNKKEKWENDTYLEKILIETNSQQVFTLNFAKKTNKASKQLS